MPEIKQWKIKDKVNTPEAERCATTYEEHVHKFALGTHYITVPKGTSVIRRDPKGKGTQLTWWVEHPQDLLCEDPISKMDAKTFGVPIPKESVFDTGKKRQ